MLRLKELYWKLFSLHEIESDLAARFFLASSLFLRGGSLNMQPA